VSGRQECNDGAVLHDWAVGLGLAWRSLWEVKDDLSEGRLVTVLDQFASPDYPVYAVVPQRRFLPARVRHFIEHLRQIYTAGLLGLSGGRAWGLSALHVSGRRLARLCLWLAGLYSANSCQIGMALR
jgi:hypothetical protein